MADSSVNITAGSGTSIDTRTEATNGNHRQVVVIGDPSTNAGVAPVDATNGVSVNITNASLAITGTFWQATQPVSLASVPSHAVTNAGTFVVQIDGSALTALQNTDTSTSAINSGVGATSDSVATQGGTGSVNAKLRLVTSQLNTISGYLDGVEGTLSNIQTAAQLSDNVVFTDDATFTPGTSSVGSIGLLADETSTDSVDEGDIGSPRMTLDRKQIVTVQPHTAGGWLTANMTTGDTFTALTNTAQAIKASAGKLGGWYIYNPNSSAAYVNIYNIAQGSVTVGTSTPKLNLCIPATSAANLEMVNGITFDTAISVSATTTGGGNTAPATALEANFWYL